MKIYTKTGDKGQTSLIGGTRVPKHHVRIEAYGTIDELNSWIGLLRDQDACLMQEPDLLLIQDRLFILGSWLASDPLKSKMQLPQFSESDVIRLENAIDTMNEKLPELKNFILPGGHPSVSYCHIARCVCRRAERNTIKLSETDSVSELSIKYLNRLSDYLFVLARHMAHELKVTETAWVPKIK